MTRRKEVYRCNICGNIVEVLHEGAGTLVCCGQPMVLEEEHNEDSGQEKHVPVIEDFGGNIKVTVGSVAHPMESAHYIEWIELIVDGEVYRKYLLPTDKPEATFLLPLTHIELSARAYCNIHGLWKS
jgi:superoxide reductase